MASLWQFSVLFGPRPNTEWTLHEDGQPSCAPIRKSVQHTFERDLPCRSSKLWALWDFSFRFWPLYFWWSASRTIAAFTSQFWQWLVLLPRKTVTLTIADRSEGFPHRAPPPQRRTKCRLSLRIHFHFFYVFHFSLFFFILSFFHSSHFFIFSVSFFILFCFFDFFVFLSVFFFFSLFFFFSFFFVRFFVFISFCSFPLPPGASSPGPSVNTLCPKKS